MSIRKAYQTLENRDIQQIESRGPFPCKRKNAWLGEGYYFWDSFIQVAHWWGQFGARYNSGYVICESSFNFDENKCLNLVDNPFHLSQIIEVRDVLIERGLFIEGETTVATVINFLRNIEEFRFEAVRACGINSIGSSSKFSSRIPFTAHGDSKSKPYLDLTPQIQINFFTKDSLQRTGFRIIYPPEFIQGYLV